MASIDENISLTRLASKRSIIVNRKSSKMNRLTVLQVPNEDQRKTLTQFCKRNEAEEFVNYRRETVIAGPLAVPTRQHNDTADLMSRHPSYRKFKIPYEMICVSRYGKSAKMYEAQLEREIRNIIDFQSTAADACYFVRCMAITSFWPPLHNMKEVKHTSKNFFQLTEKEKWRLHNIMIKDIT